MTKPQRSQRISRALVGCLVAAGERQCVERSIQGDARPLNRNRLGAVLVRNIEATVRFPSRTPGLEAFGFRFDGGGAHISRTMMLGELQAVLAGVRTSNETDYRSLVIERNILGKTTVSTRLKTFRHLRELYILDEQSPLFRLLLALHTDDSAGSLPLLAFLTAWSRDPLLRATTDGVLSAAHNESVRTPDLAALIALRFQDQYNELSRDRIARNAASTWTQSGHLSGRSHKTRVRVIPSPGAVTMALYLGTVAGYGGPSVFTCPWCQLLDLTADSARAMALEAHRAGYLDLRAVGDVVELRFPTLGSVGALQ